MLLSKLGAVCTLSSLHPLRLYKYVKPLDAGVSANEKNKSS